MIELKELLRDIAKPLVDNPDEIVITETVNGSDVLLEVNVAADDMGKIIGRHGRIAKAIRTVMKAAANSDGRRVTVEIK